MNAYRDIMSRLGPFRVKEGFEHKKTVASIEALANRADLISRGARPDTYFGQPPDVYDNLITRAYRHLESLERGELPLKGKFCEPGGSCSDHSVVVVDDKVHLFYTIDSIGYDWPERYVHYIGHASSTNLVDWEIHKPAVAIHPEGHEVYQVWAPAVIHHDGMYWMFYTGVNYNVSQATVLATSKDLYNWERYEKNPLYYPTRWNKWTQESWFDNRDVMIFKDNDTFYMYFYTAGIRKVGNAFPACGVASSKNLVDWKDETLIELGCKYACESPFMVKHENKYYLFYTDCGKGTSYAVSDNPLGGFEVKGLLIGDENHVGDTAHVPSCSEVFEFKGKWYISVAERLPGNEQYIEFMRFYWNEDGSVSVGDFVREPV